MHESNNPKAPKKKVSASTGKAGGKNGFSDYNFVRYTPTPQDKQAIAKANLSEAPAITGLLTTLPDGYKLSCSFDAKNETYTASLTCNDATSPNYRSILTGRGGSAASSLIWLAYLHFIRFDRVWFVDDFGGWDLDTP